MTDERVPRLGQNRRARRRIALRFAQDMARLKAFNQNWLWRERRSK